MADSGAVSLNLHVCACAGMGGTGKSATLRHCATHLDAEDWQAAFDERAGVLEFDGGFPRHEAERLARDEIAALYGPETGPGAMNNLTKGSRHV